MQTSMYMMFPTCLENTPVRRNRSCATTSRKTGICLPGCVWCFSPWWGCISVKCNRCVLGLSPNPGLPVCPCKTHTFFLQSQEVLDELARRLKTLSYTKKTHQRRKRDKQSILLQIGINTWYEYFTVKHLRKLVRAFPNHHIPPLRLPIRD